MDWCWCTLGDALLQTHGSNYIMAMGECHKSNYFIFLTAISFESLNSSEMVTWVHPGCWTKDQGDGELHHLHLWNNTYHEDFGYWSTMSGQRSKGAMLCQLPCLLSLSDPIIFPHSHPLPSSTDYQMTCTSPLLKTLRSRPSRRSIIHTWQHQSHLWGLMCWSFGR